MKWFRVRPGLVVTLVAILITVLYGLPASVQPWSWVWGGQGDAAGNAFLYWWLNQALHQGMDPGFDSMLSIPLGEPIRLIPHEPLFSLVENNLDRLLGDIASLNLVQLAAPPFAAWATFRLARHLGSSVPAAGLAGLGFAFTAYTFGQTRGEPALAQVEVFPLVAWAWLVMLGRPRPGRILVAAAALAVGLQVNFYYSVFVVLMLGGLTGGWILARLISRRFSARPVLAGLIAGVVGSAVGGLVLRAAIGAQTPGRAGFQRPLLELQILGIRPSDLLLSFPRNNPLLGGAAEAAYQAARARSGYTAVDNSQEHLPLLLVALALVGLILGTVALFSVGAGRRMSDPGSEAVLGMGGAALVGLWLLVPPGAHWVPGLTNLELIVHQFLPQLRFYSRAVVVVELAVAVLAAYGFDRMLRRSSARAAYALAGVVVLVGLIESYDRPPDAAWPTSAPTAYVALSKQPPGGLAEYPLLPAGQGGGLEYIYMFNQRFSGRPLLNGIVPSEADSLRDELRDPNRPGVASRLSTLGIHYILWHADIAADYGRYRPDLAAHAGLDMPSDSYYRLISRHGAVALFEVPARPLAAFAFFQDGFDGPEPGIGTGFARWLTQDQGKLGVYVRKPGRYQLSSNCRSAGLKRNLLIHSEQGVLRTEVGAEWTPISLRRNFSSGVSTLRLQAEPGAAKFPGDVRALALECTELRMEPD